MKKTHILALLLTLIFFSCTDSTTVESTTSKPLNFENLPSQSFEIDSESSQIITGRNGTRLRVNENTFIYENGESAKGNIEIELIEAISPSKIIMGGLSTIFNDSPLQTGGMIYLGAKGEKGKLLIAPSKTITVLIPTDSLLSEMSLFKGELDSLGKVFWTDPIKISEKDQDEQDIIREFEVSHNIRYNVSLNGEYLENYPDSIDAKVSELAWEGTGLKISKDSTFNMDEYKINFYKQDKLETWTRTFAKGTNSYITDYNISYIFKQKQLGWANIDRLYSDKRTEEVNLQTKFSNENNFDVVQTTLVTESMYLPGYQKKDNSFSFTHGDYETTQLPIGAKATIIGTANFEGSVYFGYKTFTIAKDQLITIELVQSSKEEIENTLETEL